jgi:hypothetical protein
MSAGVGHHLRERGTRAEAGDGAARPAVVGPPVEQLAANERRTEVRRRAASTVKPAGGSGEGGEGGDGLLAVGQVLQRLPRVARRVAAGPPH